MDKAAKSGTLCVYPVLTPLVSGDFPVDPLQPVHLQVSHHPEILETYHIDNQKIDTNIMFCTSRELNSFDVFVLGDFGDLTSKIKIELQPTRTRWCSVLL